MNLKDRVFLEGKTIYLRALEARDLNDNYFQWLNDAEVCEYNSHAIFPNTEKKMQTFFESINNTTNVTLAIVDKKSMAHIGNIALQNINWINRSAEYAILLGEKKFWGKGIASEASLLIVEYGFSRLNLHRIYCGTSADNKGMQKLAKVMKMQQEGIRKQAMFKNGKYVDIWEYGVLENTWRK